MLALASKKNDAKLVSTIEHSLVVTCKTRHLPNVLKPKASLCWATDTRNVFHIITSKRLCKGFFTCNNHVYKKFELMFTGHAKAYSSSSLQTVSLSPAILSQLLQGYRSLMPSCAGFLEPRKLRLGLSKSTFNAENFLCSLSMSISICVSAIRSCNVSCSLKS